MPLRFFRFFFLTLALVQPVFAQKKTTGKTAPLLPYFPPTQAWERKSPAALGLDADALQAAIQFAKANEAKTPRNLELSHYQSFGKEPYGYGVGPFAERGEPTGLIVYKGYLYSPRE